MNGNSKLTSGAESCGSVRRSRRGSRSSPGSETVEPEARFGSIGGIGGMKIRLQHIPPTKPLLRLHRYGWPPISGAARFQPAERLKVWRIRGSPFASRKANGSKRSGTAAAVRPVVSENRIGISGETTGLFCVRSPAHDRRLDACSNGRGVRIRPHKEATRHDRH